MAYNKLHTINHIALAAQLPALITVVLFFLLAACSRSNASCNEVSRADVSENPRPVWQTITSTEAYRMMEELDNYTLLDVRTTAEYNEMRIKGAVLIPDYEVRERIVSELPDKNTIVLVYCRSGRRSAQSAAVLAELGYTNVYDFGGILSWPFETVKGED